jgi:potassium-transporting ATPase KdpC subunit
MRKDLISSALAVVVLTIVLGLAYPLVVTGISQVALGGGPDGELVRDASGKVVGSELIARDASKPVLGADGKPQVDSDGEPVTEPDPTLFQPRPSATGYDPSATFFSNRGPNSAAARYFYRDGIAAYLQLNGPQNPGLTAAQVPADAVTTSASGVDPFISERNADIQARRVAAARRLPLARVMALVRAHRVGRFAGIFGEPGINTTTLNFDLEGIRS